MFDSLHQLSVRPASARDRGPVMRLLETAPRYHSHLDWRPIEAWVGHRPFLLAERGHRLAGVLGCPPDPADTAWLRLFTCRASEDPHNIWQHLWPPASDELRRAGVICAAGLSLDAWMDELYAQAGFRETHGVVVLQCSLRGAPPEAPSLPPGFTLRPARPGETADVAGTDLAAFAPPWQVSEAVIHEAVRQAQYLTVLESGGQIAGYQLTTASHEGGHLARLAVRPEFQGRGLGAALVADLIRHYSRLGVPRLSVNTQDTNRASLKVYQRLGFQPNGVRYPVYQLNL